MKKIQAIMCLIILVLFSPGAFAVPTPEVEAGLTPNNPLYFLDRWQESISLTFTTDEDKKAEKHLQYAQERNSELQEIENVQQIEELQNNFDKNLEKAENKKTSKEGSEDFEKAKQRIKAKNQEVLSELQQKLPKQAQKGINTAISNSNNKEESIESKLLTEFEGEIFKVESNNKTYYFKIENKEVKQISENSQSKSDYTIKIRNEEDALELVRKYQSGEEVSYDDVKEVADVPLKLKGRVASIVGLGGLE